MALGIGVSCSVDLVSETGYAGRGATQTRYPITKQVLHKQVVNLKKNRVHFAKDRKQICLKKHIMVLCLGLNQPILLSKAVYFVILSL